MTENADTTTAGEASEAASPSGREAPVARAIAPGLAGDTPAARRLREHIETVSKSTRELSRALPRAIAISAKGGGLAEALTPSVERALALGSRRDPERIAEALAPVMMRALRQALFAAVRDSFLALNQFMLKYVSITGLRWRLEARRRHLPFVQVFNEHTRNLPVKQVFLIHRETGILLQQAQSDIDTSRDWDVVTSMLTAIGDFIHDSFSVGNGDQLETIRVGDLTILIEQGEHAALAGILRGEMPEDLRERFRTALGRIHAEFGNELESFTGETSVFADSGAVLESCLQALVRTDQGRILPQTILAALLPPLAIGTAAFLLTREPARWNAYIRALIAQPGTVVLQEGMRDGKRYVHGMRDPGAIDPISLLVERGFLLENVDSRWAPFQEMRTPLTLPELSNLLDPPSSIALEMDNGMLIMRGAASQDWIDGALVRLKTVSGLPGYRTDGLVVTDLGDYRRWENYVHRLEGEPGIVVLKSGRKAGRFFIAGLRDPLARDPQTLLGEFGIEAAVVDVHWEAYQALHPTLVLERARQVLDPPSGVVLALRDGVLSATGRANWKWIERARALSRSVAGVQAFDVSRLVDQDQEEVSAVRSQIEGESFRFLVGAPDLWPGQGDRLEALVANVDNLRRACIRREQTFTIAICGHSDAAGNPQRDLAEGEDVASRFYENLRFRGMDMSIFRKRSLGAAMPSSMDPATREAQNRLVSFMVIFDPS